MPIDPELLELMTQVIVIQNPAPVTYTPVNSDGLIPPASVGSPVLDPYGRHANPLPDGSMNTSQAAWLPAVTYKCRLENSLKVVPGPEGRDRTSSGRAYLDGFYPEITTESRVILTKESQPALKVPVILSVETNYDENDFIGYNTVVHFE